jgi:3'-5' exoribonuclease 1
MFKDVDNYAVVDLEATCDDQGSVPRREMEIIEVGAVMVAAAGFEAVSEFQSFVRPVRHPRLTSFCSQHTAISQEDVDHAPAYHPLAAQLQAWLDGFGRVIFCSWGNYDRHQFVQDCAYHGVLYPLPAQHLNVKARFAKSRGLRKMPGMKRALEQVSIELEGTHHRGIDDARNIAKLLPFALGAR